MELVLPNNYVVLEQEEMMYIDGGGFGKNWWNSRGTLATGIDVALAAYSLASTISGIGLKATIRAHRGTITRVLERELGKYLPSKIGIATGVVNLALTAVGTSIGGLLAFGADWIDGRIDGYIYA
ncbi:argininosuccinate lyase [Streptococcus sp. E29BA]|uniref:argininosuccinate lyase n=1 Tax=Streptococcus sp. E29BA TaxID=3278716 RepID=UPI00359E0ED6